MHYPVFIDFEASSLRPQSYPIEVAWNAPDGTIQSFFITPGEDWTDWDDTSQEIHGIPRDILFTHGTSAVKVCHEMIQSIGDQLIYTDATHFDQAWLERLFEASGMECPIELQPITNLPHIKTLTALDGAYGRAKEIAIEAIGAHHRAAADVEMHKFIYNYTTTSLR